MLLHGLGSVGFCNWAASCGWRRLDAGAQPNKELYELQERCGRRAEETFKKEWGTNIVNTAYGQIIGSYENHYSPRLNKCFYLESSTSYERKDNKSTSLKGLRLFDLNDNKEYATFIEGLTCDVRGQQCRSEAEWRELVKPYMDD
jgi:hypothetical protein